MDPFEILPDECKYENSQSLKLQECPEDVTTGEMPRHILCRLSRYVPSFSLYSIAHWWIVCLLVLVFLLLPLSICLKPRRKYVL